MTFSQASLPALWGCPVGDVLKGFDTMGDNFREMVFSADHLASNIFRGSAQVMVSTKVGSYPTGM